MFRREVAAVVGRAQRRSCTASPTTGSRFFRRSSSRIEAELAGGVVDQPLEDVGGLRPAGARGTAPSSSCWS